jgi:hypothetical protein
MPHYKRNQYSLSTTFRSWSQTLSSTSCVLAKPSTAKLCSPPYIKEFFSCEMGIESAFVNAPWSLVLQRERASKRANISNARAKAGPPASPPPQGDGEPENLPGTDVMAARGAFERSLGLELRSKEGKDGRCTCIWCNGCGQRSCAWCRGHGMRNELESQSWDEISKNIGRKMSGEAVEMPERIPVSRINAQDSNSDRPIALPAKRQTLKANQS